MVIHTPGAEGEEPKRRHQMQVRECLARMVATSREADICHLLELAARTNESARCHHDVVEILIEKLPRQDAVATRYVFRYMLQGLCEAFEEHLAELVAPADALNARTTAETNNRTRRMSRGFGN